jgi:2-alkyl-3-oxoalkanoate reductase
LRILLVGGSGAVGRRLVPALLAAGHDVLATAMSDRGLATLREMGARSAELDVLRQEGVRRLISGERPDAIIHQATSLPHSFDFRRFDEVFATTNRLRRDGLANLLAAAVEFGVRRVVAQSYTGWTNPRTGGPVKTEADPLDPEPLAAFRPSLRTIAELERSVTSTPGVTGVALRFGALYGPGTGFDRDGDIVKAVRRRRLPLVGAAEGFWSFLHVDDAASATVAALEAEQSIVLNAVDDEPAPVRLWLPYLAAVLRAKPPLRIPVFVARIFIGAPGVMMMTSIRGASNARIKALLGWHPRLASWRQGFDELRE